MNDHQKLERLRDLARRDARHPSITERAGYLWLAAGGVERTFVHLAHALARDGIKFVRDTDRVGGEDIAGLTRAPRPNDAIEALKRGADDCDAKARLFVALCTARGVPAEIEPLWGAPGEGAGSYRAEPEPGDRLRHVYASVDLKGTRHAVELTLARARLGDHPLAVPFEREKRTWLKT